MYKFVFDLQIAANTNFSSSEKVSLKCFIPSLSDQIAFKQTAKKPKVINLIPTPRIADPKKSTKKTKEKQQICICMIVYSAIWLHVLYSVVYAVVCF